MKTITAALAMSAMLGLTAGCASMNEHAREHHAKRYGAPPLMLVEPSAQSFDATLASLTQAIETRGLKIFTIVDHAGGAEVAGLALGPSTLIVFGNPKIGTPLMQADPTMGFTLPMRAFVWEEAGAVQIGVANPDRFAYDHDLAGEEERLAKIKANLTAIQAEAAVAR